MPKKCAAALRGEQTRRRFVEALKEAGGQATNAELKKAGGQATNAELKKAMGLTRSGVRYQGNKLKAAGVIYKSDGFETTWSLMPFDEGG